jgi:ankyrin repeat protein
MTTQASTSEQLFQAIQSDDAERVQQLLVQQPDVARATNSDGLSPLLMALYFNRTAIAQQIQARVPADTLTIHEAAATGAVARVTQLADADPSAVNSWSPDGFQPLGLAAFFGQAEVVDALLPRGAEVNTRARHTFGVAAINAALAGPKPDIARTLIAAGADVNSPQNSGETPLHATAFRGNVELTQFLLDQGANRAARNSDGKTPADIARERGHNDVAELLS